MNNLTDFSFTPSELSVLHDKAFFEIKHQVIQKWEQFLSHLAQNIQKWISTNKNELPEEVKQTTPKISKGENYQGMPYMVLDYPRYFDKQDTCAFRNILLWNRGLYSTWLFEGKYIEYAIKIYAQSGSQGMYLHQNTDKWIHELTEQDIFIPSQELGQTHLTENCIHLLHTTEKKLNYLKFTNFVPFQEWNKPNLSHNIHPAMQSCLQALLNFMN